MRSFLQYKYNNQKIFCFSHWASNWWLTTSAFYCFSAVHSSSDLMTLVIALTPLLLQQPRSHILHQSVHFLPLSSNPISSLMKVSVAACWWLQATGSLSLSVIHIMLIASPPEGDQLPNSSWSLFLQTTPGIRCHRSGNAWDWTQGLNGRSSLGYANNIRYADNTTIMAEREEELKSLLMKVKEESEKAGLRLNIQKTKIMTSSSITSWQIDGEKMETVIDLIFLGSKITAYGDCSHEIKSYLFLGRKAMTSINNMLKSGDITLPTKVCLVKAMVFPVAIYGCESWTIKKAE